MSKEVWTPELVEELRKYVNDKNYVVKFHNSEVVNIDPSYVQGWIGYYFNNYEDDPQELNQTKPEDFVVFRKFPKWYAELYDS